MVALTLSALSPLWGVILPHDNWGPLDWVHLRLIFIFDIPKASINKMTPKHFFVVINSGYKLPFLKIISGILLE